MSKILIHRQFFSTSLNLNKTRQEIRNAKHVSRSEFYVSIDIKAITTVTYLRKNLLNEPCAFVFRKLYF